MKYITRILFAFAIIATLGFQLSTCVAQPNPAHWRFNVKELSASEVELQFLSRPLPAAVVPAKNADTKWAVWPGAQRTRRYNASMCIRLMPGTEDEIRSLYMKHWVETERGCEAADILMTDAEFLRGIAILQEYLDRVAVRGQVAECRWRETA